MTNEREICERESQKSPCHLFREPESDGVEEPLDKGTQKYPGLGEFVEISCLEVIRELSNYLDKDVRPELRAQIAAHLPNCEHCTAIYDGLRNTITLVGDGRSFELPAGFSQRLRVKLTQSS